MSETTKEATTALPPKKILGVFALAMINVAAVLSIRNFPSMAEYGWSSIGWYSYRDDPLFDPDLASRCRTGDRLACRRGYLCVGETGVWRQGRVYRNLLRVVQQPRLVPDRACLYRRNACVCPHPDAREQPALYVCRHDGRFLGHDPYRARRSRSHEQVFKYRCYPRGHHPVDPDYHPWCRVGP